MPTPSKGARLYLRPGDGERAPKWVILDGGRRIGLGLAAGERAEAEKRVADYLAEKHRPSRERGLDPASIPVADVLSIYLADAASRIADTDKLVWRMEALARFFGTMTLAEINGPLCRSYGAKRGSAANARRELEDLRAAINHHRREGLCDRIVEVVLPPKAPPRDRWLTRDEVARLLRTAWRYREPFRGVSTAKRPRQHVARFILAALYTGSRSAAICGAALERTEGRGYVDLAEGVFYRKAIGRAETNKRQPPVRLPTRLLAHIRRWHAKGISTHSVIEYEGRVVASIKKAFRHVSKDAGLDGVSPHTLRHSAVTWAMQNGADQYHVGGFFGLSPQMIARVYGHHHPDHQRGVGEALTRKRPGQHRASISGTNSDNRPQA
jgi:integrase